MSPRDVAFLASFIPRLRGLTAHRAPVTVDLNVVVAIRAADEEAGNAVELVLDYSSYVGNGLRLQTERTYSLRAIQLGFRDIYLRNADVSAFCHDHNRTYQWALLVEEGSFATSEGMSKIHSLNNYSVSISIPENSTERLQTSIFGHKSMMTVVAPLQSGEAKDDHSLLCHGVPANLAAYVAADICRRLVHMSRCCCACRKRSSPVTVVRDIQSEVGSY